MSPSDKQEDTIRPRRDPDNQIRVGAGVTGDRSRLRPRGLLHDMSSTDLLLRKSSVPVPPFSLFTGFTAFSTAYQISTIMPRHQRQKEKVWNAFNPQMRTDWIFNHQQQEIIVCMWWIPQSSMFLNQHVVMEEEHSTPTALHLMCHTSSTKRFKRAALSCFHDWAARPLSLLRLACRI